MKIREKFLYGMVLWEFYLVEDGSVGREERVLVLSRVFEGEECVFW